MLRKKAILLIHGFAGGAYDYGNLPNDLEFVNNYKVFTYTLPGHDKAIINKVTKDDWIKMSEMQIEKIIKHGYKEIYVIGHSVAEVDLPYFRYIENCTHRQSNWIVYFFNKEEKDRTYKNLMDSGIQKSRIQMKEASEFYNL